MVRVAIGLGSNLGDRYALLARAIEGLGDSIRNLVVSDWIETAPMYVTDQPSFLNGVAVGETELGPLALLDVLKGLERSIGRTPAERYGPREIDLDLIAYGSLRLASHRDRDLLVPHPKLIERAFVLQPLADVAPELNLPGLGTAHELAARLRSE